MAQTLQLRRVTFGDVFFCSGQSNMELSTTYSFSRNATVKAIESGKYHNIRFFHYGDMGTRYSERHPAYATTAGGPLRVFDPSSNSTNNTIEPLATSAYTPGSGGFWWNVSYAASLRPTASDSRESAAKLPANDGTLQAAYANHRLSYFSSSGSFSPQNPLDDLSSACFYFATSLSDLLGTDAPPIGLVESAVGGTKIEEWLSNSTSSGCSHEALSGVSGMLYDGMVAPFVNMTIKAALWYQGENNVGDDAGNSARHEGYGCEQQALVSSWRQIWSHELDTTPSDFPFGIVSLAPDSNEGNPQNLSALRWSQTANAGTWDTDELRNTFGAVTFDLADPWTHNTQTDANHCSHVDPKTGKYGPECVWNTSKWPTSPDLAPVEAAVRANWAPVFMGSIHPRLKFPVGYRLATAVFNLVYNGTGAKSGPTIAGCSLSVGDSKLQVLFDQESLGSESLAVRDFDADMSKWAATDAASMMACVGITNSSQARQLSAERCQAPKPYYYTDGGIDGWKAVPVRKGMNIRRGLDSFASVQVDLSGLSLGSGYGLVALRYGWPMDDSTCCPFKAEGNGTQPCWPGACPIVSSVSGMPANPWYAELVQASSGDALNGNLKCRCMPPQVCDVEAA